MESRVSGAPRYQHPLLKRRFRPSMWEGVSEAFAFARSIATARRYPLSTEEVFKFNTEDLYDRWTVIATILKGTERRVDGCSRCASMRSAVASEQFVFLA